MWFLSDPPVKSTGDPDVAGVAWRPVLAVVAVVALVHLVVATRYGWHRDEFYYVASGRHLAWGYPDQPPLTPFLARIAASAPGGVLPLRIVAIAAQAATLVLAALTARELGGRGCAQALSAACIAGAGVFVGASLLLGTTVVDQLLWALVIWATLRAIRIDSAGAWIAVGVAAGLGLENKSTVAVFLGAIFIGLAVARRPVLRRRGPWLAAAIAALLWVPNLVWDARHNWINLDTARVIADDQGGFVGSLAQLPILLILLPTPFLVLMWIRGVRWGARHPSGRDHRWLLVAAAVVVAAVTVAGGKPYYAAPMLVPLFAMGAVATEARTPAGTRLGRWTLAAVVVSIIGATVIGLPVATPSLSTALRPVNKEPMETYGWPGFAHQVQSALSKDPGAVAVYTSNYGEAGALARYGPRFGLSIPVVSGQNAYRYWRHPSGTPTNVLAVGQFDRRFLSRSWGRVERVATLTLPRGLEDEETENHAIYRCTQPKGTWDQLWPHLTYLS